MAESRIRGELERKDPAGSGVVSEQALGKVLGKLGVELAGADLGRLMHRFDVHEVTFALPWVNMYSTHPPRPGNAGVAGVDWWARGMEHLLRGTYVRCGAAKNKLPAMRKMIGERWFAQIFEDARGVNNPVLLYGIHPRTPSQPM